MTQKIKVAINGFGRIGKCAARIIIEKHPELELVAINDPRIDGTSAAYSLQFDSTFGRFAPAVHHSDDTLTVIHHDITTRVSLFHEMDPLALPWKELQIDVVLECTGLFRDSLKAGLHIQAGAKKVIISAPAKGDDIATIVQGVNEEIALQTMKKNGNGIIANASCTTNCVSPAIQLMTAQYAVSHIAGITVHAYTQSQMLQDGINAKGLRDGRAAAENLVPSKTGASDAVGLVLPAVKKILTLSAVRAPVKTGSMVYLTFELDTPTTIEKINELFCAAAKTQYAGIIEYATSELVSTDIVGNTHSCIFDSGLTMVHGNHAIITLWYDNEWGYSNRLVELAAKI
jgi:glyceraldehyde 3-phosphate dehydrogenase